VTGHRLLLEGPLDVTPPVQDAQYLDATAHFSVEDDIAVDREAAHTGAEIISAAARTWVLGKNREYGRKGRAHATAAAELSLLM
jgi:hypothetical protein